MEIIQLYRSTNSGILKSKKARAAKSALHLKNVTLWCLFLQISNYYTLDLNSKITELACHPQPQHALTIFPDINMIQLSKGRLANANTAHSLALSIIYDISAKPHVFSSTCLLSTCSKGASDGQTNRVIAFLAISTQWLCRSHSGANVKVTQKQKFVFLLVPFLLFLPAMFDF